MLHSAADCPATAETSHMSLGKKIEKMSARDPQEPTNPTQCGVPSRMKRVTPQDCCRLWSPYLWQAGYEAFRPPFPVNSSPRFRDINSSALSAARIKWQDGEAGKHQDVFPQLCLARAMSDALRGSTGRVGCQLCWGSIPTPPHPLLACSSKNHIQTQIARLHPPPPLKSIIRRSRQPVAFYSSAGSWSGVKGSGGKVGQEVGLLLIVVILATGEVWQEREPGTKVVLSRAGACTCVCDCSAAAPSTAPALAVPRAGRTWGTGYRGRRESLEHPKHSCSLACQTPGELCMLARVCARCSSIHPCPAWLHPCSVPWAVPAWVTVLQWGGSGTSHSCQVLL